MYCAFDASQVCQHVFIPKCFHVYLFYDLITARQEKETAGQKAYQLMKDPQEMLNKWLTKRAKRLKIGGVAVKEVRQETQMLPPVLVGRINLPPSVLPPPPSDRQEMCEWGD